MTVSYKQIAAEAGVSATTVHRILTGANKEVWPSASARAERIRAIAARHKFRPSASARAMRSRRTEIVGLVLRSRPGATTMDSGLFEMMVGISQVLEGQGHMAMVVRIDDRHDLAGTPPRAFRERLLDGAIVLGAMPERIYGYVQGLSPACVFLEANRFAKAGCLRRDEAASARLAVEALLAKGRRQLLYVGPGGTAADTHFSERQRLASFLRQQDRLGFGAETLRMQYDDLPRLAETLGSLGMPDPARGIVAYDHTYALRILSEMSSRGWVAGRDYGLAACDGATLTNIECPMLSRSLVSRFDMGGDAAEMLLAILRDGAGGIPSRLVKPRFHAGGTA